MRTLAREIPWHLLAAAALLTLAFGSAHLLGYREYVSFLSGTVPPGSAVLAGLVCSAVYLLTYLLAVFAVPVLLLWSLLTGLARATIGVRRR